MYPADFSCQLVFLLLTIAGYMQIHELQSVSKWSGSLKITR